MLGFANVLNASIAARLDRGLDANDNPAPPLNPRYAKFKQRRYGSAIRDWKLTGQTRGSMKVLSAAPNKATLGFLDGTRRGRRGSVTIAQVVALNQRISRQYGVSPSDKAQVLRAIQLADSPIQVKVA